MTLPKAFRDEVLAKVEYTHNVGGGKFQIPDSGCSIHKYHSDVYGIVIDIGPDYPYKDDLKVGDKIMFQRHEGKPIKIGDDEYVVLSERWVMGVVKEEVVRMGLCQKDSILSMVHKRPRIKNNQGDDMGSDECCGGREETIEEACSGLRHEIERLKGFVVRIQGNSEFRDPEDRQLPMPNIPASQHANMKENLTLVFRHLEDARMRLGKVMQAYQGGISILDNYKADEKGKVA